MFKKILKSLFNSKLTHHHKYSSSSDAWKKMNHHKHSHYGHHHYKKNKYKSGSFLSSFFSS